jgi:cell wall-associated NlpC family hydrolase
VNTASYTDTNGVAFSLATPKPLAKAGLIFVLAALTGACAGRGGTPVPRPFPGAALPPSAVEPAPEPPARTPVPVPALVSTALRFRGAPYRNGGSDPSGFDCSGFVQYVFGQFGTLLPREVRDQYRLGPSVDLEDVEAGDLLFFQTEGRGASHVGMAIGGGEFVHAPNFRGVVRVERYDAQYWARRFVGARRIAPEIATR